MKKMSPREQLKLLRNGREKLRDLSMKGRMAIQTKIEELTEIEELKVQINSCLSRMPYDMQYSKLLKQLEELEKISSTLSFGDIQERLNEIKKQYIFSRYKSFPYTCPLVAGHLGGHVIIDTLTGEDVAKFDEGRFKDYGFPNVVLDSQNRILSIDGIVYEKWVPSKK